MIRTLYARFFGTPSTAPAPDTVLKLGASFEIGLQQFTRNLQQVIVWTDRAGQQIDFKAPFFDSLLTGASACCSGDQLYRMDGDCAVWMPDAYCRQIYGEILSKALKGRDRHALVNLSHLDRLGRILMYTTCTGDAKAPEEGMCYMEERVIPPVDTWFYLKEGSQQFSPNQVLTLFCWIPKALEAAVLQHIDFEIMPHFNWLDEYAPAFHRRIKQGDSRQLAIGYPV